MSSRGQPLSHIPAAGLSDLFCHLCSHGPVCAGQCGGGCFDETSGGKQQGIVTRKDKDEVFCLFFFWWSSAFMVKCS